MSQGEGAGSGKDKGGPYEVENVGDASKADCIDFMALARVCVGDVVVLKAAHTLIIGCVKAIFQGGALRVERGDGRPVVVRLRYVAYLEVAARGGCREPA